MAPFPHRACAAEAASPVLDLAGVYIPAAMLDLRVLLHQTVLIVPLEREPALIVNGHRLEAEQVVVAAAGARIAIRSHAPQRIGGAAFSEPHLHMPAGGAWAVSMPAPQLAALRSVVLSGLRAAAGVPAPGHSADATLEQFAEIALSLASRSIWNRPLAQNWSQAIDKIDGFIDNNKKSALYLKQTADVAGVSIRKLHDVLMTIRGMSFTRYLKARRLWSVYQSLRYGSGQATVKHEALSNGFWHLGDFTRDYIHQFGESPAETRMRARTSSLAEPPSDIASIADVLGEHAL